MLSVAGRGPYLTARLFDAKLQWLASVVQVSLPLSRCQHLERSIDAPFNAARLAVSKATVGVARSKTANACASTTAKLGKAAYSS
jgi:hypothetical protein